MELTPSQTAEVAALVREYFNNVFAKKNGRSKDELLKTPKLTAEQIVRLKSALEDAETCALAFNKRRLANGAEGANDPDDASQAKPKRRISKATIAGTR